MEWEKRRGGEFIYLFFKYKISDENWRERKLEVTDPLRWTNNARQMGQ